jgi:hypothetical protein
LLSNATCTAYTAAENASFRFQSSCSLNFNEQVPNGFFVPWGEYPEVELSGEYR